MIEVINSNILDFKTDKKYHAIISDPPYGLAFMNKGWDSFKKPLDYQLWVTSWSTQLLDYLYPGAVCAFFGGTRTYHRLATGLEDAGYEIFDSMIWCYGSGFPKSYNIGKGIDKSLGLEREITNKINKLQSYGYIGNTVYGNDVDRQGVMNITKPNSSLANTWQGYGTALKPAYEPIVLCRKPLAKGGYVKSVLDYGTSGLNIDGSRIGDTVETWPQSRSYASGQMQPGGKGLTQNTGKIPNGRFPANFGLICTCEQEPCECVQNELDNQSGISKSTGGKHPKRNHSVLEESKGMFTNNRQHEIQHINDIGGASRFFYTAKASSKERELGLNKIEKQETHVTGWSGESMPVRQNGSERKMPIRSNNHPTVKPIKLIEYLAKLLLPPIENSSILIPFSGVGSEIIGSHFAGWQNITGVEVSEDYCKIAEKRIDYWTGFESYDQAMKAKSQASILPLDKQLELL